MTYLIIQTILLITIAFIVGAILGCLLRRWFAADAEPEMVKASAAPAPLAAARAPHVPAAPVPAVVPQPVAVPPAPVAPEVVDVPEEVDVPATAPVGLVSATPPAKRSTPKAKAPPKAKPAAKAKLRTRTAPKPKADPAAGDPDNLKLIRGIGPQNEGRLNDIGIRRFAQIAAWTKKDQREMGERLSFPGRIEREEWVSQAKILAKGKTTEFSGRASAGRVKTSTGVAASGGAGKKPRTLAAARKDAPDNLTLIDGVGNAIEKKLFKLGIFHFDQVAKWSEAEGVWVGNEIGFPGRVARENWIGEAKIFAEGGTTDHAARVEKGQIKTSRKSDES